MVPCKPATSSTSKQVLQRASMVCLLVHGQCVFGEATESGSPQSPVVSTNAGWTGYRGPNGNGIYPDAHPPTVAEDQVGASSSWTTNRGRNIRWKAPLPNWGYSQPVVVGEKVVVVCEAGWPDDQDFPLLVCYDAESGKELWRRTLDHLPAVIKDEKERIDVTNRWHVVMQNMRSFYTELNAGKGKEGFDRKALAERLIGGKKGWGPVMAGVKDLLKYGLILDGWWKNGVGLYCVGSAYPTPCSDGQNLYVVTGLQSFWCLDLDGNVKWLKADPFNLWWNTWGGNDFCKCARSPLIYGDLLVSDVAGKVRAFDRKTGEMRWAVDDAKKDHQCIVTPVVITTGGSDFLLYGKNGGMAALTLPEGKPVAVTNWNTVGGIMLAKNDERNVVFFSGSGDHVWWNDKNYPRPAAARFTYDTRENALQGEFLWGGLNGKSIDGNESVGIVYNQGRLYHHAGFILDSATGRLIAGSAKGDGSRAVPNTKSLLAVAGGCIYGLYDTDQGHFAGTAPKTNRGVLSVYSLEGKKVGETVLLNAPAEGEKQRQVACQNQVPVWGFSYGPTFTFSGNRIFVRSNDYLWCIGKK
jgi:hypothetical protein